MGLLGKLFGKTIEQRRERARELIREGDHGSAKIELERALEKAEAHEREDIQDEIDDCCDVIAGWRSPKPERRAAV